MTHIGGRLHRVFLQNLQHSSLYLSELARAFVGFHLLSPRTSLLTLYNPAVTSTPSCRAEYSSSHPIFFFFSCYYFISLLLCSALKSQLWGVSQHNNEPRRYLCFNWLCRRSAPGSRPKQFIHSEFLARPCYFTPLFWKRNGTVSFITAGPGANIVFSL